MTDSFFGKPAGDKTTGEIPELDEKSTGQQKENETSGLQSESGFQTEEGRMAAIMAYIPILCFVPLLNMKDNKEASFHARQGVILFLIELLAVIFLIDSISDLVFKGILMIAMALSIAGIYFALQGKNYRLPIISDLAEKSSRFTK